MRDGEGALGLFTEEKGRSPLPRGHASIAFTEKFLHIRARMKNLFHGTTH